VTRTEKLRQLRKRIREAGDRRDWDECDRLDRQIEKLKEDKHLPTGK